MKNLLLLHGALGCKEQFNKLSELLKSVVKIHAFDFNGHGRTPLSDFSVGGFVNDLDAFVIKNNIARCDVFGYSMGGYVALKHAIDHPGLLQSIITLGTKLRWNPEIAKKEMKMLNADVIEAKVPKFAETLKNRHPPGWKDVVKNTALMMQSLGDGDAITLEDFEKITIPVMTCLGDGDEMVSKEETLEVVSRLQNGEMFIMDNTPHVFEKVDIDKLSQVIIGFLREKNNDQIKDKNIVSTRI